MMKYLKSRRVLIVAGLALAPLATSAYAVSFVSTQAQEEKSTTSIIGMAVENSNGEKLGDINYLVIDNSGKISTAVVGVGGFLGVGEKNVGVPYGELKFSEKDGRRIAVIDASKDVLSGAPDYKWTEKSAMEKLQDSAASMTKKASESGSSSNSGSTGSSSGQ
jgi:sporulation protein YlmC with PRC-barrel domain